ncbi:ABC transporter permease [Intrasporangium sp.]|uniref:ABC transporter permease n=1 Tax=Intrasporangium sp. TaxID=1925024 RepID=UPI00293B82CA|nr:ABC transporter permease [Intrasporangium sp.]MDV3222996.1 ABC transporter permease [Intrasporangium sp.]
MTRWGDVVVEAALSVTARPARALLTALGATLGVGSLIAVTGLANTAGAQVSSHFEAISSTTVTITETPSRSGETVLDWNDLDDVAVLNGVEAVGARADLGTEFHVSAISALDPLDAPDPDTHVQAATPALSHAVDLHFEQGGMFDVGHSERADRIVVLGVTAAERLGITDISRQQVVLIDAAAYAIRGIYSSRAKDVDLDSSVLVPVGTAQRLTAAAGPEAVHIRTAPGATRVIAEQAPLAMSPAKPHLLQASYTPAPDRIRAQVDADMRALLLVLGGVSLLGGAVGIMNTMLVSVLERRGEIGLRRAVGARRREVLAQFLAESAGLGLVGGILGSSLGTCVVVVVSILQGWTPATNWWVAPAGVLIGGLTGLIAGLLPAWRAGRTEPADALRLG